LEVAHLSGHIARLGDALGVPVPIHRAAWAALKPFAEGRPG
jgi:ketopantoate reductase